MKNKNSPQDILEAMRYLYFCFYVAVLAGLIYGARLFSQSPSKPVESLTIFEDSLPPDELMPTAEEQALQEALKEEMQKTEPLPEPLEPSNENQSVA